jgi:hypothetical protein
MSGFMRSGTAHRRWRTALRAGALAAGLAVVVGAPLTARAAEWEHQGWRGHEWRDHQEWREHHRPYGGGYGYVAPRYYYAPSYGYYTPAPSYGYGYAYPGPSFSFSFRD